MNQSLNSYDPEAFLIHVRAKRDVSNSDEIHIKEQVLEVLNRFQEDLPARLNLEMERCERILAGINTALAVLIADQWQFDPDDDYAPFHDEKGALNWLEGNGENGDAGEPEEFLKVEENWRTRSLADIRNDILDEYHGLQGMEKAHDRMHWARLPIIPHRKMSLPLQELIYSLCIVWSQYVDEKLGLPEQTAGKSNPLLRFVDACLEIVIGSKRPAFITLSGFILKYVKKHIQDEADQLALQEASKPDLDDMDFSIPF